MKTLKEKCTSLFERISEEAGAAPLIELHGSGEVLISGCRGIIDYDSTSITVETPCGLMTLKGKGLTVSVFRGDIMSVEGKVSLLCFVEAENAD